jgi:hypothetical protein
MAIMPLCVKAIGCTSYPTRAGALCLLAIPSQVADNCDGFLLRERNKMGIQASKKYKYKGIDMTMNELSRLSSVNYKTIYHRIHVYRWSVEDAVDTPVKKEGSLPSKGSVEAEYSSNRKKSLKVFAQCTSRINAR